MCCMFKSELTLSCSGQDQLGKSDRFRPTEDGFSVKGRNYRVINHRLIHGKELRMKVTWGKVGMM